MNSSHPQDGVSPSPMYYEVGGKSPRASWGMRADTSFIFLTHHIVIVCLAERAGRTKHGTCRSDACGDQDLRNPPSTRSRSETVPPKGASAVGAWGPSLVAEAGSPLRRLGVVHRDIE